MMKKLVVLMLVLLATSMASATVMDLLVDTGKNTTDKDNLIAGDIVWLVLNSTWFSDAMDFDLTHGDLIPTVVSDGWGGFTNEVTGASTWSSAAFVEATGRVALLDTDLNGTGPSSPGGNIDFVWDFGIDTTGMAIGTYNLGLTMDPASRMSDRPISAGGVWQNLSGSDVATLSITIIPEPMTMALLGLGGLFLRRRK